MRVFMCRWPNGDVSFVSARTREDAIVMLDEWDDAEVGELKQIREFMVDFRLNDAGELELQEFGENCRDAISEYAYPVLAHTKSNAPVNSTGELTAEGADLIREAVQKERTRPLKPRRSPQPATELARELKRKMGASTTLANRAVEDMATELLDRTTEAGRKQ
jgi:hypothetical protein